MIHFRTPLFLLCLLQTTQIALPPLNNTFVVWSVGQGSWSTWIDTERCLHFDMGGESTNLKEVERHCHKKSNYIILTHLDWDHINQIRQFTSKVTQACVYYPKNHSRQWLKKLAPCPKIPSGVAVVSFGAKHGNRNSSSIIYLVFGKILITGDAPMKEERVWYRKLPRSLKVLVLGHHGSATSTSDELLFWTRPEYAVASARRSRYGHPHSKVIKKLKKFRIPLLQSEILGNIYFKLE